jgi:hypothetical protein
MAESSDPTSGLAKSVWSDADFDQMLWHDVTIHAVATHTEGLAENFQSRLLIDLDYIAAWVRPTSPDDGFSFWVSPATLVFDDVWDLAGNVDCQSCELTMNGLRRLPLNDRRPDLPRWHIEGHEFDLKFHASGYRLYIRRAPVLTDEQTLSLAERDGLAFAEIGYE